MLDTLPERVEPRLVHGGVNRVAHDLLGLAQRAEGDLDAEQVLEDRGTRRLRWHSLLGDNYISPATTITSPHPARTS
ncbi:MAG: hypothetical protein H6709_10175 [Kofleriaceae bacterium]|nr:hypothetical protein [Kofleriaceae bacterium]MCB9572441.1 hypothetical protein [Kofleriaceae bacterium]